MTESPIVNEWIAEASKESELSGVRRTLLRVLRKRFPGQVTPEITETINSQPSLDMLDDWTDQAAALPTIEEFRAYLRR